MGGGSSTIARKDNILDIPIAPSNRDIPSDIIFNPQTFDNKSYRYAITNYLPNDCNIVFYYYENNSLRSTNQFVFRSKQTIIFDQTKYSMKILDYDPDKIQILINNNWYNGDLIRLDSITSPNTNVPVDIIFNPSKIDILTNTKYIRVYNCTFNDYSIRFTRNDGSTLDYIFRSGDSLLYDEIKYTITINSMVKYDGQDLPTNKTFYDNVDGVDLSNNDGNVRRLTTKNIADNFMNVGYIQENNPDFVYNPIESLPYPYITVYNSVFTTKVTFTNILDGSVSSEYIFKTRQTIMYDGSRYKINIVGYNPDIVSLYFYDGNKATLRYANNVIGVVNRSNKKLLGFEPGLFYYIPLNSVLGYEVPVDIFNNDNRPNTDVYIRDINAQDIGQLRYWKVTLANLIPVGHRYRIALTRSTTFFLETGTLYKPIYSGDIPLAPELQEYIPTAGTFLNVLFGIIEFWT